MSDELPKPPPGITLMSPQEQQATDSPRSRGEVPASAAPSETPRTEAVALETLKLCLLARDQFEGDPEGALYEVEHRIRSLLSNAATQEAEAGSAPAVTGGITSEAPASAAPSETLKIDRFLYPEDPELCVVRRADLDMLEQSREAWMSIASRRRSA